MTSIQSAYLKHHIIVFDTSIHNMPRKENNQIFEMSKQYHGFMLGLYHYELKILTIIVQQLLSLSF